MGRYAALVLALMAMGVLGILFWYAITLVTTWADRALTAHINRKNRQARVAERIADIAERREEEEARATDPRLR